MIHELSWAIGLFEGEGCIDTVRSAHGAVGRGITMRSGDDTPQTIRSTPTTTTP